MAGWSLPDTGAGTKTVSRVYTPPPGAAKGRAGATPPPASGRGKPVTETAMRTTTLFLLFLCTLGTAACAAAKPEQGPGVSVWENGSTRTVPASRFDEAAYLSRGYHKATAPDGTTFYMRIPASDRPKDITFMSGCGGGRERSFGGMDGQFTGKKTPTGTLMPW